MTLLLAFIGAAGSSSPSNPGTWLPKKKKKGGAMKKLRLKKRKKR